MMPMEVIGVVSHLRHRSLVEAGREQLFVSSRFWPRSPTSYVVRTTHDPHAVASGVREAVRRLDASVPIYDVRTLDSYVDTARAPARFTTVVAVTFAVVAVVLAGVGVYGVMAYTVALRASEFSIRQVCGAEPSSIVRLALADAGRLGAIGLIAGALAALGLSRLMATMLYGITPWDVIAYSAAFTLLALSVLLAAWLPARRAAAAAPYSVLRMDS